MNSLILVRGLPGCGKSTFAEIISENGKYPVHSIDEYFTNENGEYHFEFQNNHIAYKNCETITEKSMQTNREKIIVDNTFTLDWEIEPYFKLAQKYNYNVFVLTVENRHNGKNKHNVSEEQLLKMAEKYKVKLM